MSEQFGKHKHPTEFRVGCVSKEPSLFERTADHVASGVNRVFEMIEGKLVDLSRKHADGTPDFPYPITLERFEATQVTSDLRVK